MLRTFCLAGAVRATDGIEVPLNALRVFTRDDNKLLVCRELRQVPVSMIASYLVSIRLVVLSTFALRVTTRSA